MFAYTILLVACAVAGSAASKAHGLNIQPSISLGHPAVIAGNTIQSQGVRHLGSIQGLIPAPKVVSNSAIGASNILHSDATRGLFSNQAIFGNPAPALVAPNTLGAIISPTHFATNAASTFNIGIGNSAAYDTAGSLGATYLLNNPGISLNSPGRRFPTSKKAGSY